MSHFLRAVLLAQDGPFFVLKKVRSSVHAFFLLPNVCFFRSGIIFQIHSARFVSRIFDLVHNERKKQAQLCKRSLADALEER